MRLVVGVGEIRQRRRIALRPRESGDAERRQRLLRHHPGRDGGRKILAEKRPERLVFPRLHVARRPVVEQTKSENMRRRPCRPARFRRAPSACRYTYRARARNPCCAMARSSARRSFCAFALALRALHRRAADAHRRGAAVIGDRHVFVVRQQRIVGAEGATGIGGVKDRRIKIGEVADRDRQQHFGLRHRGQMPAQALVAAFGAESARQGKPQRRPRLRAERHQRIQVRRGASLCSRQPPRRSNDADAAATSRI